MNLRLVALVIGATIALVGCGESKTDTSASDHNDKAITNAQEEEQSKADIIAKLRPLLKLHEYAGVDNSFTVPPGRDDVRLGEKGNQCSIEDVAVGKDQVGQLGDDDQTLISPDGNAAVTVSAFVDTPISVCLKATRDALDW